MAPFPAPLVNVKTPSIDEVLPIAVLGNENVAGLTVNCDEVTGGATPNEPDTEVEEVEPEPDDGAVTLAGTDGRGRLLQLAVSAIHASIKAIESQ
jgi:hypothetical protein